MPHVLWIPSWYTLKEDPIMGIFFKEQAQSLIEEGLRIGMIYPETRSIKNFSFPLLWNNRYQSSYRYEDGIPTCRMHGWNPFPKMEKAQMHFWAHAASSLMDLYIREQGLPDIIHAQSTLWGGIAARAISKKYAIPYVITEHRDVFLNRTPIRRCKPSPSIQDALDHASQIIAVSNALKNDLGDYTKNPLSAPTVLPCFVDPDFFTLSPTPPSPLPFRFLCIAKLIPSKNLVLLLHAFKEIHTRYPHTLLEIGGGGPEEAGLKKLASELALDKAVRFLGMISRTEARDAYHRANAFALPTQWETFGVVFIEAMAAGLPIIATRCGGPEDIICSNVGKMVTVGDQRAFTEAMAAIIENYQNYDPMAIRSKAIEQFGKKAVSRKLIAIYSQVIEG